MVRQEVIQVLTLLAGNYESFAKRTETDEQVEMLVATWLECLGDLDYKVVLQAVKKSIISSPYPPTIHDIRENAVQIMNPITQKTAIEAWNEALSMISGGLYMTQEQFDAHSSEVKKFFGNVNQVKQLAMLDSDTINSVTKGQFLKQYDVLILREKENRLLPETMKNLIGELTEKFSLSEGRR